MTFCLGVKIKDGIVGIADTRITSGKECTISKKLTVFQRQHHSMFIMTSGLRSLRDKAITYFNEVLEQEDETFDKLYKAINSFGKQLRRVYSEDKQYLEESGMNFDIHCIVGGQLQHDEEHKLYLLYPQGNWVEIREGTPYQIIGATGYGKPVLDRTLNYQDSMEHALKVGILAFDSTRISTTDVDYPIDIVICQKDKYEMREYRIYKEDLKEISSWWQERLRQSVNEIPSGELEQIIQRITC
jgi:putative proteasome-type protease